MHPSLSYRATQIFNEGRHLRPAGGPARMHPKNPVARLLYGRYGNQLYKEIQRRGECYGRQRHMRYNVEELALGRRREGVVRLEHCRSGGISVCLEARTSESTSLHRRCVEWVDDQNQDSRDVPSGWDEPMRPNSAERFGSPSPQARLGRGVADRAALDVVPPREDRSDGSGALPEPSEQRRPCG